MIRESSSEYMPVIIYFITTVEHSSHTISTHESLIHYTLFSLKGLPSVTFVMACFEHMSQRTLMFNL